MEQPMSLITFKGSISEAIVEAKQQRKLFVVYVSGENEASILLEESSSMDVADSVSKYCIFLHLLQGSTDASHFSAIYPQKSAPCVTIVGFNGVMLKQLEGHISYENLLSSIKQALVIEDSIRMEIGADVDNMTVESSVGRDAPESEDGEMMGISDGTGFTVHGLDGNVEPFIGMEFESEEAAKIYYATYARRVGFITRVGNCHRSGRDNSVISRRFLCNKEGFRLNNNKIKRLEGRKPRAITREGCKAMIMVRKEKSGKWVITKLETEHSHPLGIPNNKSRRASIQARPQDEKDKKIRELSTELHRANQQLAECRQQLDMLLNDIDQHTSHLTRSVQEIVANVKEIESEDQEIEDYSYQLSI